MTNHNANYDLFNHGYIQHVERPSSFDGFVAPRSLEILEAMGFEEQTWHDDASPKWVWTPSNELVTALMIQQNLNLDFFAVDKAVTLFVDMPYELSQFRALHTSETEAREAYRLYSLYQNMDFASGDAGDFSDEALIRTNDFDELLEFISQWLDITLDIPSLGINHKLGQSVRYSVWPLVFNGTGVVVIDGIHSTGATLDEMDEDQIATICEFGVLHDIKDIKKDGE